MEGLVKRIAALEQRTSSSGTGRDLRVIVMQIARAEEKVLQIERSSSWTRSDLGLLATEK